MEAGTLVNWVKRPGDEVHRGDIIAVVDTEKGAIEIEVFEDGVLKEIRVQPGEEVPVGTVLAVIQGPGEAAPAPGSPPLAAAPAAAPAVQPAASEPPAGVPPAAPSAPPRASPAARALARELGIDLATVRGTGADGGISRADVERVGVGAPAREPMDSAARMRQAIAGAMAQSKREIPHFYLGATVDVQRALAWLAEENAHRSIEARLLPAALLIKAVALALRDVPAMNGFWTNGAFGPGAGIHPGVAISLRGGGLVAPAIHDADRKDLSALMDALKDLVARARAGGLRSSELTDATITITNLGEQGVEVGYGIIYPPQVALVSFGRIVDQPMAIEGQVVVRPAIHATVSADHRAVDGHLAGRFLAAVGRYLQEPEAL
jgi:pyruvate dehydrogenase E2 component (dihydrolipoamide acetyltransferase)